jgi:hypothetical protein
MGILTEYNPDLALRAFTEYKKGNTDFANAVREIIG